MKTVDEIVKQYLQNQCVCWGTILLWPDARYKDQLKGLGFRWPLGSWRKKVTNATQALQILRDMDSKINNLVIAPEQEKILERLW